MPTLLITGANRGIGLEFVKQYAQKGWQVIATCRHPEKADALQQLAHNYPHILLHPLDVTHWERVEELSNELKGEKIDMLINNAGVISHAALGHLSPHLFDSLYRANAVAPLLIARAFFPHLLLGDRKLIVSMTSRVASFSQDNTKGLIAYRMSKVALNMAMQEVAQEFAASGVHVLLLSPGFVKTDMGGKNAKLEVEDSVSCMRRTLEQPHRLKSGGFYDRNGESINW